MTYTYLTAQQLAEKIQYDARTIRNQLKDSVFIEGVHYIRPIWWTQNSFCLGTH